MRVLKPDGVLVFKWSEAQIPANDVWKAIGEKPLFGHHSGKKSQTFWGCFMKLEDALTVGITQARGNPGGKEITMEETKLKPCPFCGGTKIFVGSVAEIELMDKYDENYDLYNSQFQVVCDSIAGGCGASSGCCKNKAAAIEAWNRRADNG